MSSKGIRNRFLNKSVLGSQIMTTKEWLGSSGKMNPGQTNTVTGKQMTASESNPRSPDGKYRSGGSFYTSRVNDIFDVGFLKNSYNPSLGKFYSGWISGSPPTEAEMKKLGYQNLSNSFGDKNESQMFADGTTAISRCNPINPASNLGTTLAESVREGIPSLPGIQQWEAKTRVLKGLGGEYLNYIFGWAPLVDEVHNVVHAARHHRDLLSQYHRGEGSDTHRGYVFPSQPTFTTLPEEKTTGWFGPPSGWLGGQGTRQVCLVRHTKRWFEGCFTYGLPSSTDSWRKALGYGSDADALFGLSLTPDLLWELAPWSWAVDWFTNAGDVINNVTNFGLAGLVLRYGYAMEETIEKVYAEGRCPDYSTASFEKTTGGGTWNLSNSSSGTYRRGTECVTKRRVPASPFGFSIGWEGLSPTQLAITAALGITRLL